MHTAEIKYWLLFLLPITFSACALPYQSVQQKPTTENSYYTSAYPARDISTQLEQIQHSVRRISSTAIYQTYYFDGQPITKDQLEKSEVKELASRYITHNESTAGTAFALARNDENTALLTCAHVISFPDTLISYVYGDTVPANTYISSVSIKKHQSNLVYNQPNLGRFEIIALDRLQDLALIKVSLSDLEDFYLPPLPVKMGNPQKLRVGSYIMVMGYPSGFPMVTRGIVSDPNRSEDGDFLTDALFNRGISGGLILASRNNYASFEWVGMASTAAATRELRLIPNPVSDISYQPFEPYRDSIFVQQQTQISYGITQAIPVTKVIEFLKEHKEKLARMGISVERVISSE